MFVSVLKGSTYLLLPTSSVLIYCAVTLYMANVSLDNESFLNFLYSRSLVQCYAESGIRENEPNDQCGNHDGSGDMEEPSKMRN